MANVFIVPSYACNAKCPMCLFRSSSIKECDRSSFVDAVIDIVSHPFFQQTVKVKITGGEPLLRPEKLQVALNILEQKKESIRYIGIGTNGTINLPNFLKGFSFPIQLHISRHGFDTFKTETKSIKDLVEQARDLNIEAPRLSCVMMKSGVCNIELMKAYIDYHSRQGIKAISFRELNTITTDPSCMYPGNIYDYQKFYKRQVVRINELSDSMHNDPDFVHYGTIHKPYTTKRYWRYKGTVAVLLKRVDEVQLIEYNRQHDDIDELVLHPDGLITGCWDRNLKVISYKGEPKCLADHI